MTERLLVDRDRLLNAPSKIVGSLTVRLFSAIENHRKEHQLLSLACAFVLLCDACRVPAQDVFTAAKNLMANPVRAESDARPYRPQFEAMGYHLATDVLVKPE